MYFFSVECSWVLNLDTKKCLNTKAIVTSKVKFTLRGISYNGKNNALKFQVKIVYFLI